jgi:hypothetical protein
MYFINVLLLFSVLNFKKNPHLNLNLGGDFLTNAKLTKTNINAQYGANKKDLNKKISLSSVVKHQLAWRASAVSVNGQLKHPESVSLLLNYNYCIVFRINVKCDILILCHFKLKRTNIRHNSQYV